MKIVKTRPMSEAMIRNTAKKSCRVSFSLPSHRNNVFECSSLKVFFVQSFRIFDFSNLASHSRYFQSVTLKYLPHGPLSLNGHLSTIKSVGTLLYPFHSGSLLSTALLSGED